jgi:hypothetical protein
LLLKLRRKQAEADNYFENKAVATQVNLKATAFGHGKRTRTGAAAFSRIVKALPTSETPKNNNAAFVPASIPQ